MPKAARFTLRWSQTNKRYELYEDDQFLLDAHSQHWFTWLTTHTAFAFHGRQNRFNLLKETRRNKGEGYWYAYQRQGKHTSKRYIGRSTDLTIEFLEIAFNPNEANTPLLNSKMIIPPLHDSLVRREQLLTRLDASLEQALTLLAGPAGSGKTTIVNQWLMEHQTDAFPFPVAWISLENSDNDPFRFWRYLLTACRFSPTALSQLATPPQFPFDISFLTTILTLFLNDFSQTRASQILILDDYHLITAPAIHKTLTFVIDHLPPNFHIIIITRYDPPLPLSRFRTQSKLGEINTNDLRFSLSEIQAFLSLIAPELSSLQAARQLEKQIEGWAAGLRLFALSLQGATTVQAREARLAHFSHQYGPLQSFFLSEILDKLPRSQQKFLLQTCMLPRLYASLCDTVIGGTQSTSLLASIKQAGLFLEWIEDGQWYRYQAVFGEILRTEAKNRLNSQQLQTIARQAGCWYEERGMFNEALEVAFWVEDRDYAVRVIERYLMNKHFDNLRDFYLLRSWLEQLPESLILAHPLLAFSYAQILSINFAPKQPTLTVQAQINQLLQSAKIQWQAENNLPKLGELLTFQAQNNLQADKQEEAMALAQQALNWLAEEDTHWQAVCFTILGSGTLQAGRPDRARELLHEAYRLWLTQDHPHGTRSCLLALAMVYYAIGELRLAENCYLRVAQEARKLGDNEDLMPALLGLAQIAYEGNHLEAATQLARDVWSQSEQIHGSGLLIRAGCILINTYNAQKRPELIAEIFATIKLDAHSHPNLQITLILLQIRFMLLKQESTTAIHAFQELSQPTDVILSEEYFLIKARLLLHQGKIEKAFTILQDLATAARQAERRQSLLQIEILLAIAQSRQYNRQEADKLLTDVLISSHTQGYLRLFLDEGEEMANLLHAYKPPHEEKALHDYLQHILIAFGANQQSPQIKKLVAPLSPQEERVLRLIVAERSYPEIARELGVSVNTIKTQVNSVYRKLNVHNRREARAIANSQSPFSS